MYSYELVFLIGEREIFVPIRSDVELYWDDAQNIAMRLYPNAEFQYMRTKYPGDE